MRTIYEITEPFIETVRVKLEFSTVETMFKNEVFWREPLI